MMYRHRCRFRTLSARHVINLGEERKVGQKALSVMKLGGEERKGEFGEFVTKRSSEPCTVVSRKIMLSIVISFKM